MIGGFGWVAVGVAGPPVAVTPTVWDGDVVGDRAIAGGWRFEQVAGQWRHGSDSFLSGRILAWAPGPGGSFTFVDADGVVATSEGFLGPLVRRGQLPVAPNPDRVTAVGGRITLQDRAGGWWTIDGGAPVRLDDADGDVVWAAFLDARRGARITDGGRLWTTDDGARWTPVPLGDRAALRLSAEANTMAAPDTWAVLADLTDGETRVVVAGEPPGGVPVVPPPGEAVTASVEPPNLERLAFPLPLAGPERPPPVDGRCEGAAWGDGSVAVCSGAETTAWVPTGTEEWRQIHAFGPLQGPPAAAGASLAVPARCAPGGADTPAVCLSADRGKTWGELGLPAPVDTLAVHGGRVLVGSGPPDGRTWVVGDVATGAVTPVVLPPGAAAGARIRRVSLVPEGVAAWIEADGAPALLGVGPPGRLELRATPAGAVAVGAWSSEGLAVGGGRAWVTADGGRSWTPVDLGVDGDTSGLGLRDVACGAASCAAQGPGGGVTVPAAPLGRLLGPSPAPSRTSPPPRAVVELGALACVDEPAPPREARWPRAPARTVRHEVRSVEVDAAVEVRADGAARVVWRDGAGLHASDWLPEVDPALREDPASRRAFGLLAHTARGVLLSQTPGVHEEARWWAVEGAVPSVAPSAGTGPVLEVPDGDVWTVALRGDVFEARRFPATGGESALVDRVRWGSEEWIGLGWVGEPLLVRPDHPAPFPARGLALGREGITRIEGPSALPICAGPASGDHVWVAVDPAVLDRTWNVWARIDLGPTPCLAALRARERYGWGSSLTARDGALVGETESQGRHLAARRTCRRP